jgi:hypothetical protein
MKLPSDRSIRRDVRLLQRYIAYHDDYRAVVHVVEDIDDRHLALGALDVAVRAVLEVSAPITPRRMHAQERAALAAAERLKDALD